MTNGSESKFATPYTTVPYLCTGCVSNVTEMGHITFSIPVVFQM